MSRPDLNLCFAQAAAIGFIPVAIHFDLFTLLVKIGSPATAEELLVIYQSGRHGVPSPSPLSEQ